MNSNNIGRVKLSLLFASLLLATGICLMFVRIRRENESLRSEILRLKTEQARPLDRTAIGYSGAKKPPLASTGLPSSLAADTDPGGSIERVVQLKQYLASHPEKAIPELRLLTDDDWLAQTKDMALDTEANERKALALVRQAAQDRFGKMVASAMKDYMSANGAQLPVSPAQLAPFLPDPKDADLLQGFDSCDPSTLHGSVGGWLFQKEPSVDGWYDSAYYIGNNVTLTTGSGPGWSVENAISAYQRATGGLPSNSAQVAPYLKSEMDPSTLNSIFSGLQTTPTAPPQVPSGPTSPHSNQTIGHL